VLTRTWLQCLKLKDDDPISNVTFNFDVRRYTAGPGIPPLFPFEGALVTGDETVAWQGGAGWQYQTHVESAWN